MGLITRSQTWRHQNNIQDDSHVGSPHETISEAVEHMLCIDQYDGFNSAGIETLVRILQHLEFETKEKREAKAPLDCGHYWRSTVRTTGGAVICPELLKWISSSASTDHAVLKEMRKAAEEAAAQKKLGQ